MACERERFDNPAGRIADANRGVWPDYSVEPYPDTAAERCRVGRELQAGTDLGDGFQDRGHGRDATGYLEVVDVEAFADVVVIVALERDSDLDGLADGNPAEVVAFLVPVAFDSSERSAERTAGADEVKGIGPAFANHDNVDAVHTVVRHTEPAPEPERAVLGDHERRGLEPGVHVVAVALA